MFNFFDVRAPMDIPIDLLKTFLAIIDLGSFTAASRAVHRTQSATSMQIKRLEELVDQPLFERSGRRAELTAAGETLVPYARRLLKLHEETVAAMLQPEMVGVVRIGTPDDYAQRFLPSILARFAQAYPRVQVAVRCEPSSRLSVALDQGDLDLALVTCGPGAARGKIIRRDPTVWVTSTNHLAHEEEPLPLAVFQVDCIFREWALKALDDQGKNYRIAYQSPSVAGILAAVSAGLAVTILATSIVPPDARVLGPAEGFPPLPETTIALQQATGSTSPVIASMARHIREGLQ